MKYNTLIWDWNGTLLNDISLCVDITNDILKNHTQKKITELDYRNLFGFPITEYYRKIGVDLKKESYEVLTEKFITPYSKGVLDCNLHIGVSSVLNEFRNRGKQQFILTAAHKEMVDGLLRHFSIRDYFKYIEGLDNHSAISKVERGVELIRSQKIDSGDAVMIGDTLHDFEVAEEIGIDCILISNGHQSRERLLDEVRGKAKVYKNISELID